MTTAVEREQRQGVTLFTGARHIVDVPLGPGRPTLRLTLETGPGDEPWWLTMGWGWGEGAAFYYDEKRPQFNVSAAHLDELQAALDALREVS